MRLSRSTLVGTLQRPKSTKKLFVHRRAAVGARFTGGTSELVWSVRIDAGVGLSGFAAPSAASRGS